MKITYFECDCNSCDHVLRMISDNEWPDECYIETHLKNLSFFKRLCLAVKYVFGFQSKYGHWEEYIWNKEKVIQMKNFCEEFLKENKND